MSVLGNSLYPWLEIHPPIVRRKEHIVLICNIAPYYETVKKAIGGIDLGLCAVQVELPDPGDHLPKNNFTQFKVVIAIRMIL